MGTKHLLARWLQGLNYMGHVEYLTHGRYSIKIHLFALVGISSAAGGASGVAPPGCAV